MTQAIQRLEQAVDAWLLRPEPNAAGRLGLYRIIYALTFLMGALSPSAHTLTHYQTIPPDMWKPVPILIWMSAPPGGDIMVALDAIRLVSLVLLGIGFQVRFMTLGILVSSVFLSSVGFSFGKIDHSGTFMEVYIPAVMFFSAWGSTYSLDAVLKKRRGEAVPEASDNSLRYSWPILALLWLLCIMFMISGLLKAIPPGQWIVDPELMRKFLKESNTVPNPDYLRYVLGSLPLVPFLLQWLAMGFETFYPLAVINHTWRRFFLSSTVFFHIGTHITLGIAFTGMLFFYLFFFDIQALYNRFFPKALLRPVGQLLGRLPSWALVALAFAVVGIALYIHYTPEAYNILVRPFASLLMLNIWYVAVPLAAYGIATSLPKILRGLVQGITRPAAKPEQATAS